ncbi:MAG: hypothetical protein WCO55_00530 [Candidatus Falkowbacteria bacterium]
MPQIQAAAEEYDLAAIYASLSVVMGGFLLVSLAVAIIFVPCQAVIVYLANDPERMTIAQALRLTFKNIIKIFWISLLFGVLVSLGYLILIPGIIMTISYSFAIMVFVNEGVSGWASLKRSAAYVKGQWQKIAGIYFGVSLVFLLLTLVPYVGMVGYVLMPAALTIFTDVLFRHAKLINGSILGK